MNKPKLVKCRESDRGYDLIAPDGFKLEICFGGLPPNRAEAYDVHVNLIKICRRVGYLDDRERNKDST